MDISILTDQFCEYSLILKGHSKSTIKGYRYALSRLVTITGITEIHQITPSELRALFMYGRTTLNWKVSTFLTVHKSLSIFFKWCLRNAVISTNPLEGLDLPKLEKRLPGSLSKQDAFRLLEIISNYPYEASFERYRDHAIISVGIYAGLRKQEVQRLRVMDVDIQNRTLFVYQGKGSKDRIIPMSHTLAQSLLRYLSERKRLNRTCPEFFTSKKCNIGLHDSVLRRLILRLRDISGVRFSMHKLRHTFATLMLEGGCDIYSLSKMMGHSDIKTTTIYLSASAEHLRMQVAKHPLNLNGT